MPPPENVLEFNVDGSSKGDSGRSGIGGVLRNISSKMICFFSKAVGTRWTFEAKVEAILHAMLFCQEHNLRDVVVESDSFLVVGW